MTVILLVPSVGIRIPDSFGWPKIFRPLTFSRNQRNLSRAPNNHKQREGPNSGLNGFHLPPHKTVLPINLSSSLFGRLPLAPVALALGSHGDSRGRCRTRPPRPPTRGGTKTPHPQILPTQSAPIDPFDPAVNPIFCVQSYVRLWIREYLHNSPTSTSFIAGGVAGAVSRTLVSPLERMKILFQIQGPGTASYSGVWPTLVKMWHEEGWRGFMRGNGTNCIRIIPYSACQFAAYTTYKRVPNIPLIMAVSFPPLALCLVVVRWW